MLCFLLSILISLVACVQASRARLPGKAGWETSPEKRVCPCKTASLCNPVTRVGPERVYAFHTAGASDWRLYDWEQLTTVCVFGELDPEMLCHAHSHGVRVTFGSGGLTHPMDWHNESKVSAFVNATVNKVVSAFADGTVLTNCIASITGDRNSLVRTNRLQH